MTATTTPTLPTKTKTGSDQGNYSAVTVTPLEHRDLMSTSAATIEVLAPVGNNTLGELLIAAIAEHAGLGRIPTADERVSALQQVLADSRWRTYRAGRVRVAGLTGVYWHWLAPPLDNHQPAHGDNRCRLMWTDGHVVFADLFVVDEPFTDTATVERVAAAVDAGHELHGDRFAGVRVLHLAAPHRSRLVTSSRDTPLTGSSLWFGTKP